MHEGRRVRLRLLGLDVLRRQQRLFPLLGTVVRLFNGSRRSLSAMASRAAKFSQRVRNDRMLAKRHRADIGEACFLKPEMASGTAVGHLLLGNPDLLNAALEVALQGDGISASTDEM